MRLDVHKCQTMKGVLEMQSITEDKMSIVQRKMWCEVGVVWHQTGGATVVDTDAAVGGE